MLLDSLFNAAPTEKLQNPTIRFDYKTENIRFRLGTDLAQMNLIVRHFVEGIGYVKCNQNPTRLRDGRFGLFGDCEFCKIRKAAKDELKAKLLAEGRAEATKDESKAADSVMKRQIILVGTAEVEVRKKGEVVKPLESKAITFRVSDMFFEQVTQHYKTLSEIYQNKGTLLGRWYTMSGKGTIMMDDPCTADENARDIEVDLTYFDKQTKPYSSGVEKLQKRVESVSSAEPIVEESEIVEEVTEDGQTIF